MKSCWPHAFLAVVIALSLVGCSKKGDGLVKQQVHGQVFVNGKPYRGVVVRFSHLDTTVKGNAARPIAVTGDNGGFALSTNDDKDGAVAGEYVVTFSWHDNSPSQMDFFKGKYSDRTKSKFRVTVGDTAEELPPFELETDEENVKVAEAKLSQNPPVAPR